MCIAGAFSDKATPDIDYVTQCFPQDVSWWGTF